MPNKSSNNRAFDIEKHCNPKQVHLFNGYAFRSGMELAFRVGKSKDWVEPPENFPKCGTWPEKQLHNEATKICTKNVAFYITLLLFSTHAFIVNIQ